MGICKWKALKAAQLGHHDEVVVEPHCPKLMDRSERGRHPKALVAPRQAVAERSLEGITDPTLCGTFGNTVRCTNDGSKPTRGQRMPGAGLN